MNLRKRHPFSILSDGETGFYGIKAGQRIVLKDGRHGYLDEALPDGDAYVSLDDGTFVTVPWYYIEEEKSP